MYIDIPENVETIIRIFKNNGYEAYAVGGCVRDSLLNKQPQDWDITTSASPDRIKSLFNKTIDTGIVHGTVTVRIGGESYEVTTYRIDGEYEDGRHPKSVCFTASLTEDLRRRDFTINAMAYSPDEGLIDIFGGMEDLKAGIIRCVGDADERFAEDALRTLRAVRFAGQLGFNIEEKTYKAICNASAGIKNISFERIRVELSKLIVSDGPDRLVIAYDTGLTGMFFPEWDRMMETTQNNPNHIYTVGIHTIKAVEAVKKIYKGNDERELRILSWSALLHDVAKPVCRSCDENGTEHFYGHPDKGADMAVKILRRLKFDNYTINMVSRLIKYHDYRFSGSKKELRRFISRAGIDIIPLLFILMEADVSAQSDYHRDDKLRLLKYAGELFDEIVADGETLTIKELKINGHDIIEMGVSEGKQIGKILDKLFEEVIDNPKLNNREYLLCRAEEIAEKNNFSF